MELSILNLLVVLVVAWIAGQLARRLGYPSVLGELLAGIVLGPPLLGLIEGSEALKVLADVGILLMMVYIGMEIDPRSLRKASMAGMLAAIGGFVTPFVLCYFAVTAFGGSTLAGIFVGVAAGVTSLATKSRILVDLQLLDTRIAYVMMAGALIADTVSLIIFAAVLGVAETNNLDAVGLLLIAAKAVAFFVVAAVVGTRVFPWIGNRLFAGNKFVRTSTFMLVLIVALSFAEMAHLAGMHGILGAFVAGLFLREGVFGRTRAHELMEVVRDASIGFLAPIFFVTAGFAVSLDVFQTDLALLTLVVGLATVGKIVGTALFYLPTGNGWREGLTIGAGMNGRGAVEIIIAQIGLSMGLITEEIFSILVFMAIFTTATVPVLLKLGTDWLRRRGELVRSDDERSGVLIVGGGATARAIGKLLVRSQPVFMVDRNPDHCLLAHGDGLNAIQGDALDEAILSRAGAAQVRTALILTPNVEVNALTAQLLRTTFLVPELAVLESTEAEGRESLIRHLQARTLFAGPADLPTWDYRLDNDQFIQTRLTLERPQGPRELSGTAATELDSIPVVVQRGDAMLPFHDGLALLDGDHVFMLRSVRAVLPSRIDRFDRLVARAPILDLDQPLDSETFFAMAASLLAGELGRDEPSLATMLLDRERRGSTVILPGLAIPHVILPGEKTFSMLLARCRGGITFPNEAESVHAVFVLAGSEDERTFHLRALSAIAQAAQQPNFEVAWLTAHSAEDLRQLVLHTERRRFEAPDLI